MSKEYKQDVVALYELTAEMNARWDVTGYKITSSKDWISVFNALEWLRTNRDDFMQKVDTSGSIEQGQISNALDQLVIAERGMHKYFKNEQNQLEKVTSNFR